MKKQMRSYIWVVEMEEYDRTSHPTVGVALTRNDAIAELRKWKSANHHERFRLRKYQSV